MRSSFLKSFGCWTYKKAISNQEKCAIFVSKVRYSAVELKMAKAFGKHCAIFASKV